MKLVAKGMDATLDLGGDDTIKWVTNVYLQACRQGFGPVPGKFLSIVMEDVKHPPRTLGEGGGEYSIRGQSPTFFLHPPENCCLPA